MADTAVTTNKKLAKFGASALNTGLSVMTTLYQAHERFKAYLV